MDPSRDGAGSAEQDEYEVLRREELARAQRNAQAQQDSSRPPITLRLPLGPEKGIQAPEDRSQTSIENRMRALEDLIMKLTMNPKSSTSKESPNPIPLTVETPVYQDTSPKQDLLEHSRIPVRNKRFTEVLSISSYRLRDRHDQLPFDQSVSLTQVSNQIRPRMEGYYFSGESPLRVLPFLRHLTRIADQSRISEATLLWIVEDFLQSPARESFRAQTLTTWPEAVHWLLVTFAPEPSLERAVRKLNLASQTALETVKQFGLSLQLEASMLGSLISLSEVKSLFSQGLDEPIRSLFAAHQPAHELDDSTPLSVLVARAELLETGTTRGSASTKPFTRTSRPVLASPEVHADQESTNLEEDPPVLAFNAASGPKSMVCFVCYFIGHWWIECPCLSHLSAEEKEDIAVRRRTYYSNPTRPNKKLQDRNSEGSSAIMARPGWQTEKGMVSPAPIWPSTVVKKKELSSLEKAPATPKTC